MPKMEDAVADIRYLLERGYPRRGAITYVCNHYRFDTGVRHIFTRVIYPEDVTGSRKTKTVGCDKVKGEKVWIDGYNVLIGIESALTGEPVYLCDDGFIRDTRGVFRNYRCSGATVEALDAVLEGLVRSKPSEVEILFDSQISKSGETARWVDKRIKDAGLSGSAGTSKHVDHDLKNCIGVVSTSDGSIIDAAKKVVNLQACVLAQQNITPIMIEGLVI